MAQFGRRMNPSISRFDAGKGPKGLPDRVVIYIHVFKTGGCSIKDTLMSMAGEESSLGYATIIRGRVKNSKDRSGTYRDHQRSPLSHPATLDYLRHNMDIVGGHQLFDTANTIWPELPESAFQKLLYIRDPLRRFVSGTIFVNRTLGREIHDVADTVEFLKNKNLEDKPYRIRYWRDLATEEESKNPELQNNYEKQVGIIKGRLDSLDMIGAVERWEQSLKLLHAIVAPADKNLEVPNIHVNSNVIPTGEVISAIKSDDALYSKLLRYLEFEQEIYEYGLRLHLSQCARGNIQ